MSKPIIEIWDGANVQNPSSERTVELDLDYVQIKVNNVIAKKDVNGKIVEKDQYHDLVKCTENDFKTDQEKEFFNHNNHRIQYCI